MPTLRFPLLAFIAGLSLPCWSAPGEVDADFTVNDFSSASGVAMALQPDGRFLVNVPTLFDVSSSEAGGLRRFHPEGSEDASFNATWKPGYLIRDLVIQPDGRVLLACNSQYGTGRAVMRLLADGSVDRSFQHAVSGNEVLCLALQPDGKILAGHSRYSGESVVQWLSRLHNDGSVDISFNTDLEGEVRALAVQSDGKILVGGEFNFPGRPQSNLVRLYADGSLDDTFCPHASGPVDCLALVPDGKMLVGGYFESIGGLPLASLVRLNADGSRDLGFQTRLLNSDGRSIGRVSGLAVQADGKIIIGGVFAFVEGVARPNLARLMANGTLDVTFATPELFNHAERVLLQPDGRVLVGGGFTTNSVQRFQNDPAIQSVTITGGATKTLRWLRGGSAPEILEAVFEMSQDFGRTYTHLGSGRRIAGGWELSGVALPPSGQIRASSTTAGCCGGWGRYQVVSSTVAFGRTPAPEISVQTETTPSLVLEDGGQWIFAPANPGTAITRTLTIINHGDLNLKLLAARIIGPDAESFVLVKAPANRVRGGGGSTQVEVQFTPNDVLGPRRAMLQLATSDRSEHIFDLSLLAEVRLSDNADLSDLKASNLSFSPEFDSQVTAYSGSVPFSQTSVDFTTITAQAGATVRINGVPDKTSWAVLPGINVFTIKVTAQDGVTEKAYTVTVTRAEGAVGAAISLSSRFKTNAFVLEPDGSLLLGKSQSSFSGLIFRIRPGGDYDPAFQPEISGDTLPEVLALIVQPDLKLVVGGRFTAVNGEPRSGVARLHRDGSLDSSFSDLGLDGAVTGLLLQRDGKVVLWGSFTQVAGQSRSGLARLNSDGTLDTGFAPTISGGSVACMAQQSVDDRLLIGGSFLEVNGTSRLRLARLEVDGTLDLGFNPGVDATVDCLAVQPADGRIVIGGSFSTVAGTARYSLARLDADGTLDASFNVYTTPGVTISTLLMQADGSMVVGNSSPMAGSLARINAHGTRVLLNSDLTNFQSALLQDDGYATALYFSGRLRRIAIGSPVDALQVQPSQINWQRGGTVPEAEEVFFDLSADRGASYSHLGQGLRIAGGWQLTGLNLPASGQVRARARTTGGLVESVVVFGSGALPTPEIAVQRGSVPVLDGSSIDLGTIYAQEDIMLPLRIKNTGEAPLRIGDFRITGANADMLAISEYPLSETSGPSGESTLNLRLRSPVTGNVTATLQIESNDADEADYDITFTANALTSRNAELRYVGILPVGENTSYENVSGASVMTATLPARAYQVKLTAKTNAERITELLVNGVPLASEEQSAPISITAGLNAIPISITALDGTVKNYMLNIARLYGAVDESFAADANSSVYSTASLSGDRLLVGGGFTNISGVQRQKIARLLSDGTLDGGFSPLIQSDVNAIAVQADGSCLVAGSYPLGAAHLCRFRPSGFVDSSFNPGLDGLVTAIAVQEDGKILIGGQFLNVGGVSRVGVARLHADGTLDTSFQANLINSGTAPLVRCVALQRGGRVLIGGSFTSVGGVARSYLARLEADGSLDASFAPVSSAPVNALLVLPDDRLLVGGLFSTGSYLGRIASDGTLDASFIPPINNLVYSLALQSDGKVCVGGNFTASSGGRNRLLRLLPDGTLDSAFDAAAVAFGSVFSIQLQPDGKLVVGSDYFQTGGIDTGRQLVRLENGAASESLVLTAPDRVEWLHGGTAPGVMQVRFDLSVDNGVTYNLLGYGTSIAGGWELAGLTLPAAGQLRASARVVGGRHNGSSYTITRTLAFGAPAAPNLVVTDANEVPLPNEAAINAPLSSPGSVRAFNVVLHNTGAAPLTGLTGTLDGLNANEFSLAQPVPSVLAAGGVVVVSVRFTASATGTRSAVLHLTSNEASDHDLHLSVPVELEHNADLVSLAVTDQTLAPAFLKTTTDYALSVPFNVSTLAVTARRAGGFSSISIGSAPSVSTSTVTSSVALVPGLNVIPVVVTAQDGTTMKTYNLNVTRAANEALGEMQLGFDPQVSGGIVSTIATQGDGKILIGGAFTSVRGTIQPYLARLNEDGTLDAAFAPAVSAEVKCILVLPSGKILIGGNFSSVNRQYSARIVRLNSDGTPDPSFISPFNLSVGSVLCMVQQPQDGMFLVGTSSQFFRLNVDGTLDTGFVVRPNGAVNTIAVQTHGRIVIGGDFTTVNSIARNRIARLSATGGIEGAFNPNIDGTVAKVLLPAQSDQADKILVFGSFAKAQGTARQRIVRLNVNGTIDGAYMAQADGSIHAAIAQADGKVLIAGDFTGINGTAQAAIARLNVDGTLDTAFSTSSPSASVSGLALLANGQVLAGGAFTTFGALNRGNLVRLANNVATDSLNVVNSRQVDWLRSGAAPEFTSVSFDVSLNSGVSWHAMPASQVSRIDGGWRFAPAVGLPPSGIVRAHGSTTGGTQGSSSGLVMVSAPFSGYAGPVLQVSQGSTTLVAGQTMNVGQMILGTTRTVSLTLRNTGNQPLTISPGSVLTVTPQQAELVIIKQPASTILPGRSSDLVVRIRATESGTSLRHAGLRITHNDAFSGPFAVSVQLSVPAAPSLYNLGDSHRLLPAGLRHDIAFDVQTGGVPPTYQWLKNGVPLTLRSPSAVLKLHPVKLSDAGIYTLVVTTAYGKTSSDPVYIGVVAPGPAIVRAKPGRSVMLTCQAKAPPGLALAYRWMRFDGQNELFLTDSSKLVLPGVQSIVSDIYVCYVDMLSETAPVTQSVSNGDTLLIIDQTPVVSPFSLPPAYVGQRMSLQVPATGNPTRFSAQGLPPGMVLASNGLLSGKPLAAGFRNVLFTASNLAGSSVPIAVPWTILPLPAGAVGSFAGLVDRAPLNDNLGGYFAITTSGSASFTGYLMLGGERIPVAGVMDTPPGGQNPELRIKVSPYAPESVLVVDTATQSIAGVLEDGINGSASSAGLRNVWSTANPSTAYVGRYNAGLVPPSMAFSDATTYPQGTGYVQANVMSQGAVTWIGHLSDGSVALQSVVVGPRGELPLHSPLYLNQTGSLNGWSQVDSVSGHVDGVLDWSKQVQPPASRARSYAAGFPLHELTLMGAKYTPPAPGTRVLGLLPAPPDNAEMVFSNGGFVSPFSQTFSITAKNDVVMPLVNPLQVLVYLAPTTGTFSGSFTLTDSDLLDVTPPVGVVRRVTTFQGALVTRPGMNKGVGYFNLAELPDARGEALSNTPQWSGKIELGSP